MVYTSGVVLGVVGFLTSDAVGAIRSCGSQHSPSPGKKKKKKKKKGGLQGVQSASTSDSEPMFHEVVAHDRVIDGVVSIDEVGDGLPGCLFSWVSKPQCVQHELLVLALVANDVLHNEIKKVFLCVLWSGRSCGKVSSGYKSLELHNVEHVMCFTFLW